jgi:NACHT domain
MRGVQLLAWIGAGLVPVALAFTFIPKELWKRLRWRILDRVEVGLLRGFSRFPGRYREFVLTKQRHIDLKGLATVGFYNPELAEVFVDVSLAYRAPHEIPASVVDRVPVNVTDRHSIGEFLDHPTPLVLAVIGSAGSGKTTLLRHTAQSICRARRRRRPVPILLYLRDHVVALADDRDVTLPALVRATLGRYAAHEPPGWFEQRLADGDCVVLLDGLDEVADTEQRRQVSDWVARWIEQYPRNDWIISARPDGYRTAPVAGALVMQVRGFTDEQVAAFLDGWFLAVEKQRGGGAGEEVLRRARLQARELLDKVMATPNLRDLAVNPLLLTMIANVHLYRGALPGSRADLYREICEVLLWRRGESKGLAGVLPGDKKTILLNALAFGMMRRRVRDLPRAEVLAELESSLSRMSTPMTAEEFLGEVQSYGILVERESDQLAFAHLTFQESLAAAHIRSKGLGDVLADAVNDSWWRETTLLYVAQSDADRIVRACVDAGTVAAWSLAFDCAAESGDLSRELRDELDVLLDTEHHDPELQRLRVGVRAMRYLNANVRLSTGERVCAQPVPAALYRLFCEEAGWHFLPDVMPGAANGIVRGVRASDARAFADWITGLAGGELACTLPTGAQVGELMSGGPAVPECSVWTVASDLWAPDKLAGANRITMEQLRDRLVADCELLSPLLRRMLLVELSHILTSHIPAVRSKPLRAEMIETSESYREIRHMALWATERIQPVPEQVMPAVEVLALGPVATMDLEPLSALVSELDEAIHEASVAGAQYASVVVGQAGDDQRAVANSVMMNRRYDAIRVAWRLRAAIPEDHVRHYLDKALTRVVGEPEDTWDAALAWALASTVPVDLFEQPIVFDEVVELLLDGRLLNDARLSQEVTERVERLVQYALPVFARRTELTRPLAAGIRLAATCLADEVLDDRQRRDLRGLACATTALELRMVGALPATETIVLAVS